MMNHEINEINEIINDIIIFEGWMSIPNEGKSNSYEVQNQTDDNVKQTAIIFLTCQKYFQLECSILDPEGWMIL